MATNRYDLYLGVGVDSERCLVQRVHPVDPLTAALLLEAEVIDGVVFGKRVVLKKTRSA